MQKKTKVVLGCLVAALFLISGLAAYFGNQVKELRTEAHSLLEQHDQLVAISKTAETKIKEAETRARTSESKYSNLLVATNPLTGEALLGHDGKPLYNTQTGSSKEMESLKRDMETLRSRAEYLSKTTKIQLARIDRLTAETMRPARSPWEYGLGYSAPLVTWLSLPGATYWLGTAYHVPILGQDVGIHGELGAPSRVLASGVGWFEEAQGKLYFSFRP